MNAFSLPARDDAFDLPRPAIPAAEIEGRAVAIARTLDGLAVSEAVAILDVARDLIMKLSRVSTSALS